jgi:two-component system response regulator FixJ
MPGKQTVYVTIDEGRYREHADAAARLAVLSAREWQVLEALVEGHPNKIIAYHLGIAVRTVEVHRARILGRLRLRTTAEAIRLAVLATLALQKSASDDT